MLENSDASGALSVQTVSGDMKLEGNDAGTAYFKTTSGGIRVNKANISDGGAELITTSGELKLEELVTDGTLQIKTSSGDVHFER